MDFKKKSRPFFIIVFKLKNGNFKTRDFSPLIETVLAGVRLIVLLIEQFIALDLQIRSKTYLKLEVLD